MPRRVPSAARRASRVRLVTAACLSALALAACSGGGTEERAAGEGPTRTDGKGADTGKSLFDKKTLNVAVKKGQPGFSTRSEEEDDFAGFEAQLVQFLSTDLHFKAADWDVQSRNREKVLTERSMDLVVATYSITAPRDREVDFTAPYLKTYQGVLVRKKENGIKRLADVDGKRVCSVRGSTGDPESERDAKAKKAVRDALGPNVVAELRNSYKSCVKELTRGNFSAVWTDKIILEGFAQDPRYHDDVKVVRNITVKKKQFYGVGLREGHEADCRRLNDALKRFLDTQWALAFRAHFPSITERVAGYEQQYKPTDDEFEALAKTSCGAGE
ncbi:transporter substrate-binding domain-containing protein [Streptomyces luteocolor]|uniref:transporter substrate-binding domain-containing protein n=1 Tax=Streptomyces luteocolor TaxID=285500 RepID=UPI00099FFBD0|nr:transporter substrate-binding domain-containing protein [Streptomyces luteocolor]MCF3122448.1 transporter substrate-binding domain-containing protein [Streptomyces arenae]